MLNTLKVGLLLTALTALLIFMGRLVGGPTGMIMAFGFAMVMNLGSYWFSDKIVLRMYRAQPVGPNEAPQLYETVARLAQKANIPMPRLYVIPDPALNAFATGRSPSHAAVAATEGILRTLTSDDPTPSPFPRNKITVFEEPRLREQDFGNFQPCSAEMERMWQERADYGHFFYRIPDGESAADAYDRVSGFNESLWRQFGDEDFPSVCVLVTHGMMSRVFLMKW